MSDKIRELSIAAAAKIIDDMCGRSGGDAWYESCDEQTQFEIRDEWSDIIYAHFDVREA